MILDDWYDVSANFKILNFLFPVRFYLTLRLSLQITVILASNHEKSVRFLFCQHFV